MRNPIQIARQLLRLESLLAIAILTLAIQILPLSPLEEPFSKVGDYAYDKLGDLATGIGSVLDVRRWPRSVWLALNAAFVVVMLAFRFRVSLRRGIEHFIRGGQRGGENSNSVEVDQDYEARVKRDAEWKERAAKRLPHY